MEDQGLFPEETKYFIEISRKLEEALQEADAAVEGAEREYQEEKRYMAQYRGEIDPHEMFQNEMGLKRVDSSGAFAVKVRDTLTKLKDSPYFARVDFQMEEPGELLKCYIGRFAFTHEHELLICDWRSPVAGLFYDYELGPGGYDAPAGRIEGRVTQKRQFKISAGKMEYVLESSVNIQDNILQRELSRASDEKMKSIITTIQKEQNQVIRKEQAENLIIQGAAGSGKTSIALHRIAFLLYQYKDRLAARNVAILSPNKIFGDYISNVLPELGEEPVGEISFAEIAQVQLEGILEFEPDRDPFETMDTAWAKRVQFKSTLDFLKQADCYLQQMPERVFQAADCILEGFAVEAGWIQSRFEAYGKYPVKLRLQRIAEDIHNRFETDNWREESVPRLGAIVKCLNAMLGVKNALALYKDFYKQIGRPDLFVMPGKKTLEWNDVYPFLYFRGAFEGLRESKRIKHLVVDEMQDYTPVQYAVLNCLFHCPKTILGDYGQVINPNHQTSLTDLRQFFQEAKYIELNKSYRSTYEIIEFAKSIQSTAKVEPVMRHGEAPRLIFCESKEEEINCLREMIGSFEQSGCASLGILVKTNQEAEQLYKRLSQFCAVHLLSPQNSRFVNGVSVASVQMSKGLEFDQVVIYEANNTAYQTEQDRGLLYVACTRAMHRLTLLYTGNLSPLIKQDGELDREKRV